MTDVARGGAEAFEFKVHSLDEEVGGDDRVEPRALRDDGGVVADTDAER